MLRGILNHPLSGDMTGHGFPKSAVVAFGVAALALTYAAARRDRPPDPPPVETIEPAPPDADALLIRSAAKGVVARDVADGHLTLVDATALFAHIDAHCRVAETPPARFLLVGGAKIGEGDEETEGEVRCLQVMLWANTYAPPGPGGRAVLTERLRAEYRAARRSGALAELPPASEEVFRDVMARAIERADRLKFGSRNGG
jgi:hypothetical protein